MDLLFQVKTVNGCIQALSSQTPPTSSRSLEQSRGSSGELSDSASTPMFLDELGESTLSSLDIEEKAVNKKIRELLEESQLLMMQFSINRLSLEIHSRGDPFLPEFYFGIIQIME